MSAVEFPNLCKKHEARYFCSHPALAHVVWNAQSFAQGNFFNTCTQNQETCTATFFSSTYCAAASAARTCSSNSLLQPSYQKSRYNADGIVDARTIRCYPLNKRL